MFRNNPVILALVSIVALAGAIVLAALHDPIPDFVPAIALAAFGALAGVALPQSATQPTPPAPQTPQQPAAGTPPPATAVVPVLTTVTAVPPVQSAA